MLFYPSIIRIKIQQKIKKSGQLQRSRRDRVIAWILVFQKNSFRLSISRAELLNAR